MAFWGNTTQYISSVKYSAVTQWATGTAKSVGNLVRQLATPSLNNERVFMCIVAGTTHATTEPTWTFSRGDKITDNTVTWIEVTGLAGVNGDGPNTPAYSAVAGHGPSVGSLITDNAGTHLFICTTAVGNAGGGEPTWNTSAVGNTTSDGSNTWTYIGLVSSFTAWGAPHARLQNAFQGNWPNTATGNTTKHFVGHDHAETQSSTLTFSQIGNASLPTLNALDILCVNTAGSVPPVSADLRTSATITTTGTSSMNLQGCWRLCYGITFVCGSSGACALNINNDASTDKNFENCNFQLGSGTSSASYIAAGPSVSVGRLTLRGCTFKFANVSQGFQPASRTVLINCSVDGTGSIPTSFIPGVGNGVLLTGTDCLFEAGDYSALSGSNFVAYSGNVENFKIGFVDCKFPASFTPVNYTGNNSETASSSFYFSRCSSGANPWQFYYSDKNGILQASNTIYRGSGAADNGVNYSWSLATQVITNLGSNAFQAPPIAEYNTKTAQNVTVTVSGVVNAAAVPTNAQMWLEVQYLGASGNTQATVATTRVADALATPSSLTTDSSSWTAPARQNGHTYSVGDVMQPTGNNTRVFFCTTGGASAGSEPGGYASAVDGGSVTDGAAVFRAGCRFKMSLTLSSPQPQQQGALYAKVFAGLPSTTYYVDPLAVLS